MDKKGQNGINKPLFCVIYPKKQGRNPNMNKNATKMNFYYKNA